VRSGRDVVLVWNGLVAEPPRLARRGEPPGEEAGPPTQVDGALEVPDPNATAKPSPGGRAAVPWQSPAAHRDFTSLPTGHEAS
jgi:hypothetical protein